jgi:hypothetical protein
MFAGMIVMSVWGGVIEGLGTIGGILAGFLIIGVMWFLNHHLGLVYHGPQSGFVDLGMGVGFTGIFRDMWISILGDGNINALTDSLPTIAFVVIGALIGGYLAAMVERDLNKDAEVNG